MNKFLSRLSTFDFLVLKSFYLIVQENILCSSETKLSLIMLLTDPTSLLCSKVTLLLSWILRAENDFDRERCGRGLSLGHSKTWREQESHCKFRIKYEIFLHSDNNGGFQVPECLWCSTGELEHSDWAGVEGIST